MNLLHTCAVDGSAKCAALLLKKQISPNIRDKRGNLPIHYACYSNSVAMCKLLLPYSKMNEQNLEGDTPLHICA